ncbi:MAG: hypothetical protein RQ756_06880, partial [Flavobacteriaceae bacterium]|nr:hypothetical protein [Flavobacteriaceae bacterium]
MYSGEIDIVKSTESRLASLDLKNLTFGKTFSDHMLFALYEDGKWSKAEIKPYGALSVMPSLMCFHYGQTIFEGMKPFKDDAGKGAITVASAPGAWNGVWVLADPSALAALHEGDYIKVTGKV